MSSNYNLPKVEDDVKERGLGQTKRYPNDSGDLIKNLDQQIGRMSADEYLAVTEIVLRAKDQKAAIPKTVQ